jgi:hypothetical protein
MVGLLRLMLGCMLGLLHGLLVGLPPAGLLGLASLLCGRPVPDDLACVVCRVRDRCLLLLPCRHLCLCQECEAPLLAVSTACPVCRQQIDQTESRCSPCIFCVTQQIM